MICIRSFDQKSENCKPNLNLYSVRMLQFLRVQISRKILQVLMNNFSRKYINPKILSPSTASSPSEELIQLYVANKKRHTP